MQNHQIKFISEIISDDIRNRANHIKDYKILELGCGDGKGVNLMSNILKSKHGELNIEVFGLDYQQQTYNHQKLKFLIS